MLSQVVPAGTGSDSCYHSTPLSIQPQHSTRQPQNFHSFQYFLVVYCERNFKVTQRDIECNLQAQYLAHTAATHRIAMLVQSFQPCLYTFCTSMYTTKCTRKSTTCSTCPSEQTLLSHICGSQAGINEKHTFNISISTCQNQHTSITSLFQTPHTAIRCLWPAVKTIEIAPKGTVNMPVHVY